eukprot:3938429-Rhodomonas_salina.2
MCGNGQHLQEKPIQPHPNRGVPRARNARSRPYSCGPRPFLRLALANLWAVGPVVFSVGVCWVFFCQEDRERGEEVVVYLWEAGWWCGASAMSGTDIAHVYMSGTRIGHARPCLEAMSGTETGRSGTLILGSEGDAVAMQALRAVRPSRALRARYAMPGTLVTGAYAMSGTEIPGAYAMAGAGK